MIGILLQNKEYLHKYKCKHKLTHTFWMPTRSHNILKSISSPLPPVQSLDHIVPRQLYHYSCPGRMLSDSSAFLSPCLFVSQCKTSPSTQTAHCCRGRVWQTTNVHEQYKLIKEVVQYCKFLIKQELISANKIKRSIHLRF